MFDVSWRSIIDTVLIKRRYNILKIIEDVKKLEYSTYDGQFGQFTMLHEKIIK